MLHWIFNEFPDPKAVEEKMIRMYSVNRLASDDSSFTIGSVISVDGGLLAGWT